MLSSRKFLNIIKVCSSIILAIIAFDLIINFILPDDVKKKIGITRNYSIKSSKFHHELAPNIDVNEFWGKNKYNVKSNNFGMRIGPNDNKNIDLEKNYVGFIGDSFVYGSGINYEYHFISKIKKKLPNYNLLNLGYVSYSPSIYFKKLENLIKFKNLKFVKVFVFVDASDIQDEGVFYRENFRGDIVRKWLNDDENYIKLRKYKIKNYLQQNSFLFKFYQMISLPNITDKSVNCLKQNSEFNNFLNYIDQERFSYGINDNLKNKSWVLDGKKKVVRYLDKIKDLSVNKNFEMIIVYYPSALEILENYEFKNSDHFKLLYDWSISTKTSFINTSNEFDKFPRGNEGYKKNFIECDVHWNSNGHDIIASKIIKFLNEKNN